MSSGGGGSGGGFTNVTAKCVHCGQQIVGNPGITFIMCGEGAGSYHEGCLRIFENGNTLAELRKEIAELKAYLPGHEDSGKEKG